MNKYERLEAINAKKVEIREFVEAKDLENAKIAKQELIDMQAEYDILSDIEEEEVKNMESKIPVVDTVVETPVDHVADFANAARHLFKNQMSEGSQPDGGYTVPEDIQTRINKYRDAEFSLADLVRKESVSTETGARTFQSKAQQTGFSEVAEGGAIKAGATPQFERLTYSIKKYGGYFPVTNELLADSDVNITSVLTEWIGGESRATRNKLILDAIATKTAEDLADLDGIKKALNVTLGQAYKGSSAIITNDDGLNYLDTLKDANGRYILNPDPTDSAKMTLRCGANIVPVKVIPNKDLATTDSKVPFIIGDLNEGVQLFDRQKTSILGSNIASVSGLNAFEQDLTLFRALEREDVVVRDADAFVNGYITVA